jgi:hypothetical protein
MDLPERDEFVTKVIRVMIKFNKGVVNRDTAQCFLIMCVPISLTLIFIRCIYIICYLLFYCFIIQSNPIQYLMGCESYLRKRRTSVSSRATNRPENIVIRRTFIISEVANLQHFHFSQLA